MKDHCSVSTKLDLPFDALIYFLLHLLNNIKIKYQIKIYKIKRIREFFERTHMKV